MLLQLGEMGSFDGADGFLNALHLSQMMPEVDGVKTPPLVDAHGSEKKMSSSALNAEALAAGIEELIHLLDFLAEDLQQFFSLHGRPVELPGTRKGWGGRAPRHVAEYQHHHLQQPLHHAAVALRRPAAL